MKNLLRVYFIFTLIIISLTACENNSDDDDSNILSVGDIGQGGIIFFDKGFSSDGWRYIEVALFDIRGTQWGCFGSAITNARNTEIGSGMDNTIAIEAFHNALGEFSEKPEICNALNDGTVAANMSLEFEFNGFDDWFLPSQEELFLAFENLHLNDLGGFIETNLYWTSTEQDEFTAITTDFSNGNQEPSPKAFLLSEKDTLLVRPIRYFN